MSDFFKNANLNLLLLWIMTNFGFNPIGRSSNKTLDKVTAMSKVVSVIFLYYYYLIKKNIRNFEAVCGPYGLIRSKVKIKRLFLSLLNHPVDLNENQHIITSDFGFSNQTSKFICATEAESYIYIVNFAKCFPCKSYAML